MTDMERIHEIRQELEDYIYNMIVPEYAAFDPAHREDHTLDHLNEKTEMTDTCNCDSMK